MAIWGNFSEMPLPEALRAVGSQVGVFITSLPGGRRCEVFLKKGVVIAMSEDGKPIEDVMRLHACFSELVALREGDFEFRRLPAVRVEGKFAVPLEQLLISGLAYTTDLSAMGSFLPSSTTVFEATGPTDLFLGDELQVFWERVFGPLQTGASAEDLASLALTSVVKAQWYLYKLQLAGLLKARRVTWEHAVRNAGDSAPRVPKGEGDLSAVLPAKPGRPLVARIMKCLSRLLPRRGERPEAAQH